MAHVERYNELPIIARRFLETLDDERVRSIVLAADVFGDMDAETLILLRNPKPELIRFLVEMREAEIEELQNAIDLVRAFRRTGRVVRWSIATLFGAFVSMVLIWDKVSSWFKAR